MDLIGSGHPPYPRGTYDGVDNCREMPRFLVQLTPHRAPVYNPVFLPPSPRLSLSSSLPSSCLPSSALLSPNRFRSGRPLHRPTDLYAVLHPLGWASIALNSGLAY